MTSSPAILTDRGDALVVTGLGSRPMTLLPPATIRSIFICGARMGGAAMIGLGLALAQPKRRVLVITGDGEMLMGLGSLATIGAERPKNLSIIVIDNEHYGETGMQPTHTGRGVDMPGMAKAAGFAAATTVYSAAQLKTWIPKLYRAPGPVFATSRSRPTPCRWRCRCATARRSSTVSAKRCSARKAFE